MQKSSCAWNIDTFVCHYWQWPILINCVMCYYLCVLRWLMRLILALHWLLQIEQERSEQESSGDALVLAFRCARFCSASLILFASYSPAPPLMRRRHFVRHNNVMKVELDYQENHSLYLCCRSFIKNANFAWKLQSDFHDFIKFSAKLQLFLLLLSTTSATSSSNYDVKTFKMK